MWLSLRGVAKKKGVGSRERALALAKGKSPEEGPAQLLREGAKRRGQNLGLLLSQGPRGRGGAKRKGLNYW